MADSLADKLHPATPRRRQQARERGQVARSQEVASAVVLVGSALATIWLGPSVVETVGRITLDQLGGEPWVTADISRLVQSWYTIVGALAVVLAPLFGLSLLWGALGNLVQIGFLFLPERVFPDLSRVNPAQGFARLGSMANLTRLFMGIAKTGVLAAVAVYTLLAERDRILNCAQLPVPELAVFIAETLVWTALRMGVALLLLAGLDYALERWRYERDLRMTAQEMREEMRDMQANPQVAARRKFLRRRQANAPSPWGAAGRADLVVTSASGIAVALRYDPRAMTAPILIAKGAGESAQQLRQLAAKSRVTIVDRRDLAEALYGAVEIDGPIPHRHYAAIAALLASVAPAVERGLAPITPATGI